MRIVWIDPNFFYLYPNSIQTGGVVQFCLSIVVVSVADINSDQHVDDGLIKILKLKYSRDFEVGQNTRK